jgi:hypothetical protein
MDIKKAASISPSIDQASPAEKSSESTPKAINTGVAKIQDSFSQFVSEMAPNGGAVDPNAVVQYVLRESYVQTTEDLRYYADKVKYFNECKKDVRDYLETMRDAGSKLKEEFGTMQPDQKSNVMEAVTQVIKDSVQDNNEIKKHYLDLLGNMNRVSDSVAETQKRFAEASATLTPKKKDDDD